MNMNQKRKRIGIVLLAILLVVGAVIAWAFLSTMNKTELEVNIHINEQLVYQSTYGESPTFAIWLEDPESGKIQTVYVTNRAAHSDWAGKSEVPVALPKWFELTESSQHEENDTQRDKLIISGATPKPGYFSTRVNVQPGSKWICWIEMNLAGDYNETYKEYDPVAMVSDEYGLGQPALLYKVEIVAELGNEAEPEVAGMVLLDAQNGAVIRKPEGITSASEVFDQLSVRVVKPKPKIIK